MTDTHEHTQEMSSGRDNSLMLVVDLRAGEGRVIEDARPIRELADATRAAQQTGELRLAASIAA